MPPPKCLGCPNLVPNALGCYMGAGLLFLVLRGTLKGHRADKRVSDDCVSDERDPNALGNCHGHIMAMTVFMAMAMTLPCDGHDHAMFAGINMAMAVSSPWPRHSQGECHGESHDLGKS